jgi:hypothetical protein
MKILKHKKIIFGMGLICILVFISVSAQIPTSTAVKTLTDEQWFQMLRPNLSGEFPNYEMTIMQKQLALSDQQVKDVENFLNLVAQADQSAKEDWYVQTLKDRSNGEVTPTDGAVGESQNQANNARTQLIDFIGSFRSDLGNKEPDFVLWVQDDSFITADVFLTLRKNSEMTSEQVAEEVFKDKQSLNDLKGIKDFEKYKRWFLNRARIQFFGFAFRQEDVRKDKVRFQQLKDERKSLWEEIQSEQ